MTNLFILTASGGHDTEQHYIDTIEQGFTLDKIEPFLDKSKINVLGDIYGNRLIKAWGAKPGKQNIPNWRSMKPGDYVLIYRKKKIEYIAEVTFKTENEDLAKDLWGSEGGITWKYIYFLDNLRKVDLSLKNYIELLGYKENYNPQGFSPISDKKIEKFGSVEGLISNLTEDFEDLPLLEDLEEEQEEKSEKEVIKKTKKDPRKIEKLIEEKSKNPIKGETVVTAKAYKRDDELISALKIKYDGVCQSCKNTFEKKDGDNYAEGAHIIPLNEGGTNTKENILVLCPTCHKKLDIGCKEVKEEVIENVRRNFPNKNYVFEELDLEND